ncbi:hypothetical protein GCM10027451_49880 [Geodermatophilus aquaeductus]|uniref:Uncharacterized protein n=1 Tax=Geodermatophilus aquaeductus TaxID=1564161 RepID=A0A521BZ42_9ACTN|nr:hypothetical protein SAMN06273567_10210 [Geodermatophilus aquaeductus]
MYITRSISHRRHRAGLVERDEQGNVVPLVAIVTDNGGPFRSFRFEAFIAPHPSCGTCAPASRHPDRTAHMSAGSTR